MTKEQFKELKIKDELVYIGTMGFSFIITGVDKRGFRGQTIYIAQKNACGWIQEISEEDCDKFAKIG